MFDQQRIVSVLGLGYVGLPVAVAFGKKQLTIGFDIKSERISELQSGVDHTNEVSSEDLKNTEIQFTCDEQDLKKANFHIVAVPTPINKARQPDLTPILAVTKMLAGILKKGDVVVYESTVYPGLTEEICLPLLEEGSGLKAGNDFKVGYSPERINPGDREHTLTKIKKIVSGQDPEALKIIAQVYESIIEAGVHRVSSIKVAEAAKVIENTQRDLNIALMNELAIIFDRLDIDTKEVIDAASTKWNFIKFFPGLVGGHCIGVDPYYLTHKAEQVGYHPQVILAGRRINDGMGKYIAERTIKSIVNAGHNVMGSTVTVLGLTFKEDCPDIRNSKVIDVIQEFSKFGIDVQVCDPWVSAKEAKDVYDVDVVDQDKLKPAHALVAAVAHKQFKELDSEAVQGLLVDQGAVIDVKGCWSAQDFKNGQVSYWRL